LNNHKKPRDVGFYVLIFIVLLATIYMLVSSNDADKLSYSEVRDLFAQEKVDSFTIEGDTLILHLREPVENRTTVTYDLYSFSVFL